jgi:2,4-dienoyl-CoA reductase-like NADH-dependent reductase (Old Yellow Enzyme family)
MADDQTGHPLPKQTALYRALARGGVGLIITGHMYVHSSGKAHKNMVGIHDDAVVPYLAEAIGAVHQDGGKVVAQISHAGMQAKAVSDPIAPSSVSLHTLKCPAREMTEAEIDEAIDSFGQASRRAKEAGFDGIQIHGGHGYLVNQFLSPLVNHRSDRWGSDAPDSVRFLRAVCGDIRRQVGPDYPVLIKLGMEDHLKGGLTADRGMQIVAELEKMGINGVEITGGIGLPHFSNIRKNIVHEAEEAYFLPLARKARCVTRLPILLVGGFRSRRIMEAVLSEGAADFISLSRPLICEPDLPNRLRTHLQERSRCISAGNCWPVNLGDGIGCKCQTAD